MKICTTSHTWIAVILTLSLLLVGRALASGEIDKEDWFEPHYQVHPAELIAYATENPGVLQGGYWRVYLFLAYRSLLGRPLSAEQVKELEVDGWHIDYLAEWPDSTPVEVWLQARQELPEIASVKIDQYRSIDFSNYLNCAPDAFLKAAETLKDRRRQGGDQWAGEWLKGQDAVFANCGDGDTLILPPELPADAPAWLQADRRYQRAAALFYAGLFDQARDLFLAIAEDRDSPWSSLGVYLAARALTRKASLECGNLDFFTEPAEDCRLNLLQAEQDLTPSLTTLPAARGLYGWLRIRSAPYQRFDELANLLATPELPTDFHQLLADYLLMFDRFPPERLGDVAAPLTQWIAVMQASVNPEEREEALKSARSLRQRYGGEPWLVPLLLVAREGELTADELQAARAVGESSPAYLTIRYHLARMAIESGRHDEAHRIAGEVLAQHGGKMSHSSRNRFASLQLRSAPTPDAFFAAAPRSYLKLDKTGSVFREPAKASDFLTAYDQDATGALNVWVPLDNLKLFAARKDLPGEMARMLPEAVWTRAVLLGDFATADEITELLPPAPETEALWQRYKTAATVPDKKVAASLILINTPQLRPYVEPVRDLYTHYWFSPYWWSRYWWCDLAGEEDDSDESAAPPLFLTEEEKDRAKKEQEILKKLPNGTDYLAPLILARARAVPDDPEIPKALHLLVQATKGGCITEKSGKYSKDAFRLLHRKYPKSEWTEKTPYHY